MRVECPSSSEPLGDREGREPRHVRAARSRQAGPRHARPGSRHLQFTTRATSGWRENRRSRWNPNDSRGRVEHSFSRKPTGGEEKSFSHARGSPDRSRFGDSNPRARSVTFGTPRASSSGRLAENLNVKCTRRGNFGAEGTPR